MTGSFWLDLAIGIAAALALAWVVLVIALVIVPPRGGLLREAMRILPDALRLIRRLAADKTLPVGIRVRLVLLMVYLEIPFDPIPDFIPVLGYADDAIIVAAVLRSVVRRAGLNAVRAHWPGSDDGFAALCRLTGLRRATDRSDSSTGQPFPGAARDGTLLAGAPWGISLPEVTFTPLLFWHGELDTNVPIATTRTLTEALPRCDPTYYPDDGHLSVIVNHGHEIIATLASCRK